MARAVLLVVALWAVCASPGQAQDAAPRGLDGLPDPAFWTHDAEGPARLWLDKPQIDAADLRRRLPAWREVLAGHGVDLDLDSRTVSVRGATIHDALRIGDPIEYLVVTELGKTHEALVLVRAQPSVLDACLKALMLQPGGHTTFREKDPPPPGEDIEHGRASPWQVKAAHGPLIDISVSWVDEDGKPHSDSLESWLLDLRSETSLPDMGWIYTGSAFGTYRQGKAEKRWLKADVEGDIVAIYLAGRNSCLFERNSLDGMDDSFYFPDPRVVPPQGTPVTVSFRARDDAVLASEWQEGLRVDWTELDGEGEAGIAPAGGSDEGQGASGGEAGVRDDNG